MTEPKRFSLIKPTIQTHFHIDYDWWGQNDHNWRVDLRGFLCPKHQVAFADSNGDDLVDWVDQTTAEVQRVDGLQHVLITHCAKEAGFITQRTTLVDSVFRIFLANGNSPLTPVELSEQLGRPSVTILTTLSGNRVYKGLRPCPNC